MLGPCCFDPRCCICMTWLNFTHREIGSSSRVMTSMVEVLGSNLSPLHHLSWSIWWIFSACAGNCRILPQIIQWRTPSILFAIHYLLIIQAFSLYDFSHRQRRLMYIPQVKKYEAIQSYYFLCWSSSYFEGLVFESGPNVHRLFRESYGFRQQFQENSWIAPYNRLQLSPTTPFPIHRIIRRCVICVTEEASLHKMCLFYCCPDYRICHGKSLGCKICTWQGCSGREHDQRDIRVCICKPTLNQFILNKFLQAVISGNY